MIFINNALKKIGNEGLIVNLKANNFYEGEESLSGEDFDQLYEVFKANTNMNLSQSQKIIYIYVFFIMNIITMRKLNKFYLINYQTMMNYYPKELQKSNYIYYLI